MRKRSSCRGFTFFEITLGMALFAIATLAVTSTYGSASRVANESQLDLRASRENRRSLEAVANALRAADTDTMTGFDAQGKASVLTFSRVEGATLSARSHAPSEVIRWEQTGTSAGGVAIGNVTLLGSSTQRILAAHVPDGGFTVSRAGPTLVVSVTTSYPMAGVERLEVRGRTAITLRN